MEKIFIILKHIECGGIASISIKLANMLSKNGYEVSIFSVCRRTDNSPHGTSCPSSRILPSLTEMLLIIGGQGVQPVYLLLQGKPAAGGQPVAALASARCGIDLLDHACTHKAVQ